MISDLSSFLQKVMVQALAKSPNLSSVLMNQDKSESEAYLAEVLGDRLASLFETDESNGSSHGEKTDTNLSSDLLDDYEALVERNGVLAVAMGACDCWGEHADCHVCHGYGSPGWTIPDKQLFKTYVNPAINAVRRLKKSRSVPRVEIGNLINGG